MMGLSSSAGIGLFVVGDVIIVAAVLAIVLRGRTRRTRPDIPDAMKPGPSDPALETPLLQKLQGWGLLLVAFFVVWIPYVWLREPSTNLAQDKDLKAAAIQRGSEAVQFYSEDNQLGVGCVRCHGPQLTGGVILSGATFAFPPNLTTVCGGPNTGHPLIKSLADIYTTIQQGRGVMPSWSIRYAGALDDQQINDLVNYLVYVSSKHVPYSENVCINPDAVKKAEGTTSTSSASPSASASPSP